MEIIVKMLDSMTKCNIFSKFMIFYILFLKKKCVNYTFIAVNRTQVMC